MKYLDKLETLAESRGITGHRAATRFIHDLKTNLVYHELMGYGKAEDVVELLSDDNNLTDNAKLNTNFRSGFDGLISPALRNNENFMATFRVVLDNNGKGVGAGELVLPLLLSNYRFSNDSDGEFDYNGKTYKTEIKKNGASLKPVKTGLTQKGHIDELNKKYFNGTVPGKRSKRKQDAHLATVNDPNVYREYFEQVYVGCDTTLLCEEIINGDYQDIDYFTTKLGQFALREYKKVDGWHNIMYIDGDKEIVVNITDIDSIDNALGIYFAPVMHRGGDVQAIADGYVNVQIKAKI